MPLPDESVLAQAESDTALAVKAREQAPDWESVRSEFGAKAHIHERPDGQVECNIDLSDEADRARYNGMMDRWRAAENDAGAEFHSRTPLMTLEDAAGRQHTLPVTAEDRARKHGLKRPGNRLWFLGRISGRWLQCGHRASFADVHGRCTVCGEAQ